MMFSFCFVYNSADLLLDNIVIKEYIPENCYMWPETMYQVFIKCMTDCRMVPDDQDATICFIKRGYLPIYSQIHNMYHEAQCQIMQAQILWEIQDDSDQN